MQSCRGQVPEGLDLAGADVPDDSGPHSLPALPLLLACAGILGPLALPLHSSLKMLPWPSGLLEASHPACSLTDSQSSCLGFHLSRHPRWTCLPSLPLLLLPCDPANPCSVTD